MITVQQVVDGVNGMIVQQYTDCPFYIQRVPQGFVRPSFFISLIDWESEGKNTALTDESFMLQVVYFAPVDDHNNQNGLDQISVCDGLLGIFKKGFMRVADRALKFKKIKCTPRDDEVFMTIECEFTDDRPEPPGTYETMNEVKIRQEV